jgi:uncharacterized protein YxjI
MSVRVVCTCGTSYELKDEFAGRLVKCPQCGRENRVPAAAVAARPQADPVFDRDLFLLRQQLMRISETYEVGDEKGANIVFVVRPAHLAQSLGALLAAAAVWAVVTLGMLALAARFPQGNAVGDALTFVGVVAGIAAAVVVGVALSPKRHVTFYRDASKRDRLLEVLQDKKWQPITATYTVRDFKGQPLARLAKNWLYNLVRKRWYVYDPGGRLLYTAKEDSIILSLLRRFLGPLFGLLRTNFLILRGDSEDVVGEFKRKFTILDRYVLDLSADPQRLVDRRIALALGLMLDTGERR